MFSKKQYQLLLLSAMGTFFIIALFIYMFYIRMVPDRIIDQSFTPKSSVENIQKSEPIRENQAVMTQDISKIKPHTRVIFEIVDQFGVVTESQAYKGMNWLGLTKIQMSTMFPDYLIREFEEDRVILTREIERQVEPSYILTTLNGNIVISIKQDGQKLFFKETGLEQHDFSHKLEEVLEKGIPITIEQKDAILDDANELYIILQEYDE